MYLAPSLAQRQSENFLVKTILQEICKSYKCFLARLAKSCTTSCKSNLARKIFCKVFLQDSCNIFYILQEKLHF